VGREGLAGREGLVAALVGLVSFLPFLPGALSGASLYFRDLALYFIPLRRLALDGLGHGQVRFWNPYLHEGVPLSLPAVAYPVDLLQLLRPSEAGISLVLALHVPLAALGFYALARRLLGSPPVAAAGGALVYALGGFLLSTVNLYLYLHAAAWAPLVLLTLARATTGASPRAVAGAALVLAIALSTTGVELVAQAVVVGLVLGWGPGGGPPLRRLARAGGSVGLGVLIAAPALVLVGAQVGDSARSQGFITDVVLAHSIHPFTLLQTLVGGLYGNLANVAEEWWGQNFFPRGFPYFLSLYLGASALAVAALATTVRHPLRTRLVLLVVAGLAIGLGRWAGLAPVVDALPALRAFRYPVKAFFTVHLSVALLVSLGLAHLLSGDRRLMWGRLAVGAGALGGLLALAPLLPHLAPAAMGRFAAAFFPSGFDPGVKIALLSRVLTDAAKGGGLALALAAVAGMARLGRLAPATATALVVALLGADLLRTGSGLNPMVTGEFFRPSPELAEALPSLRDGRVFSCAFDASRAYHDGRRARGAAHETWTFAVALETLTPAFNVPLRVPTAMSPDLTMLVPADRVLSPTEAGCQDLDAILPRLRLAGVHAVFSLDPLTHPGLQQREVLRSNRIAPTNVHVYDLTEPLLHTRVASIVVPVESATEGARKAARPGFQQAGGTAVEGARAVTGARGRVERIRRQPGQLEIVAEADSPTVVVVRDGWAAGWTARVNGRATVVRRADGRHLAVDLPGGRSEVVLRYRPPGLGPALAVSALALAALGVLYRSGRRRATSQDPAPRG
jgi:hypothetical protein